MKKGSFSPMSSFALFWVLGVAQIVILCIGSAPAASGDAEEVVGSHQAVRVVSENQIMDYALGHIERLGLWAGARDRKEYLSLYRVDSIRAVESVDPDGAWAISFEGDLGERILSMRLSTTGKLLRLTYLWHNLSGRIQNIDDKPSLTAVEALALAKQAVTGIRGSFPDNVVLQTAEYVVPSDSDLRDDLEFHCAYWLFSWQMRDRGIRYTASNLSLCFSPEFGVLSFRDSYRNLKTRHVPRISLDQAVVVSRKPVREHHEKKAAGLRGIMANPRLFCYPHLEAQVWDIPGDQHDILYYTVLWRARWYREGTEQRPNIELPLTVRIDAVTSEPIDVRARPEKVQMRLVRRQSAGKQSHNEVREQNE